MQLNTKNTNFSLKVTLRWNGSRGGVNTDKITANLYFFFVD